MTSLADCVGVIADFNLRGESFDSILSTSISLTKRIYSIYYTERNFGDKAEILHSRKSDVA